MAAKEPVELDAHPETTFRQAKWPGDLPTVRRLFEDYRGWLEEHRDPAPSSESRARSGLKLIDELISGLPGAYGPPNGEILLWHEHGNLVACGALREIEPKVAEIKRIYIRADHRGKGFGPRWVRALLDRARALGYERVRVDTLSSMSAAIEFYQELGFRPIPPFWPHPAAGALFFEYRVAESPSNRG